jgi:hypothetical protein
MIKVAFTDSDEKDARLQTIQSLILNKEQLLSNRMHSLPMLKSDNPYINDVCDDIEQCRRELITPIQEQLMALNRLDDYLDGLIKEKGKGGDALTKHNISDAKREKQKIGKEIKQLTKLLEKHYTK